MKIHYRASRANGEVYEETAEARDQYALARTLREKGEVLISVQQHEKKSKEEKKFSLAGLKKLEFSFGVRLYEKILFTRNLGALLEAGLPMSRALSVLERQMKNPAFKKVVKKLSEGIHGGDPLYASMEKHPKVFPPIFIAMVKAGEESGSLAESLSVLAMQQERIYTLKKKVRGAMMYPAIVLSAMVLIGILMFVYVVPTLTATFEELDAKLPLSTKIIIGISELIQTHPWLLLGATLGAIVGFISFLRTKRGKRMFDFFVLHIPLIRDIVKEVNAARTARTLSSLLAAGVEIVYAIGITREVIQNSYFKEVLARAESSIQKGTALSEVFIDHGGFYPILVGEMISVGEETGKLSDMLMNLASFYETEVDRKTKDMSTVIEPFLMIVIGVAVGFFALSIITPIYSLVGSF